MESLNYDFIFGVDFLNNFKAVIGFGNCVLKIEGFELILIAKHKIDVNIPLMLHCYSDVS